MGAALDLGCPQCFAVPCLCPIPLVSPLLMTHLSGYLPLSARRRTKRYEANVWMDHKQMYLGEWGARGLEQGDPQPEPEVIKSKHSHSLLVCPFPWAFLGSQCALLLPTRSAP